MLLKTGNVPAKNLNNQYTPLVELPKLGGRGGMATLVYTKHGCCSCKVPLNWFSVSNHHQKLSHLHFYGLSFTTQQNYKREHAPFCFAFHSTKYASISLRVVLISKSKVRRHLGGTDGSRLANSRTVTFKVRLLTTRVGSDLKSSPPFQKEQVSLQ